MQFIDLKAQYELYQTEIDRRMRIVLDHGRFIMGPEIDELEAKLADYTGVRHAITVSSGTHSLEIALRALGVGPGDEVITVPFSWISSAEVIMLVGARPVFVDILPGCFTMDPDALQSAITPRTKAVIPVGLFGQMPDMERINEIAGHHGISVIEDAAQSFGATRNGLPSCGASLVGSTSFFPAKPLGCYGDGGALFTNDDNLAAAMKAIRTHGGERRHHHTHVGTNGRFDTLQAAVILGKWNGFPDEVRRRQEIGLRYNDLLRDVVGVPEISAGNSHVFAQYTIRVAYRGIGSHESAVHDSGNFSSKVPVVPNKDSLLDLTNSDDLSTTYRGTGSTPPVRHSGNNSESLDILPRDHLQDFLNNRGIPTGVYYPKCFHEQPVFESLGYRYGDFPQSERASREVLSLPMGPFLTEADQDKVVVAVKDWFFR
jgi:UDP-2-acetamido-2-deoxy-ribo-hexuluronate aminotransferase